MLPSSLVQPLRQGQLTVGAGWRAYFAPFNQAYAVNQSSTAVGPSIYDLAVSGKFLSGAPPAGWSDLGFISKFKFTPGSKTGNIIAGYRVAIKAKYRAEVGEKLPQRFFHGTGCRNCQGTGYRGRTCVMELMPVTEGIRALILRRASGGEIRQEALR